MRKALVIGIVVALAALGIAGENIEARIDRLLHRWTDGDDAARAGVAAETLALGEPAVAELYRRLARDRFDAGAPELGTRLSDGKQEPDTSRAIQVEVAVIRPAAGVPLPARPTLLAPEQGGRLIANGETVSAPSLVCYEGQRAHVMVSSQASYTRTFDARRQAVAATVSSGLMLDMRARGIEGTNRIALELRCVRAQLDGDAVSTLKTADGEIGMPTVTKRELAVTLPIEAGVPTAIALPGDEPLVLRVTAKRVELPDDR